MRHLDFICVSRCGYEVGGLVHFFCDQRPKTFSFLVGHRPPQVKMASVLLLMCGLSVTTSLTHMLVMDFGSSSELLR